MSVFVTVCMSLSVYARVCVCKCVHLRDVCDSVHVSVSVCECAHNTNVYVRKSVCGVCVCVFE